MWPVHRSQEGPKAPRRAPATAVCLPSWGQSLRAQGQGKKGKSQPLAALTWEDERVHAVMGLVQYHEGEYRHWHKAWGPVPGGHDMDWQRYRGPAPGHPFFCHHQLQLQPGTSGSRSLADTRRYSPRPLQHFTPSTILRSAAGQTLEDAYESRNVYIVSLPEILRFASRSSWATAAEVYDAWRECEVIIGKRPRSGHNTSRWW